MSTCTLRLSELLPGEAGAANAALFAAALIALFVHALFYSGFFEDPITWFALGLAGAFAAERALAREPVAALGHADSAAGTTR